MKAAGYGGGWRRGGGERIRREGRGRRTGCRLFVGVVLIREEDARVQLGAPSQENGFGAFLNRLLARHNPEDNGRSAFHVHEGVVVGRRCIKNHRRQFSGVRRGVLPRPVDLRMESSLLGQRRPRNGRRRH